MLQKIHFPKQKVLMEFFKSEHKNHVSHGLTISNHLPSLFDAKTTLKKYAFFSSSFDELVMRSREMGIVEEKKKQF
jgi:hypothetical protein